ncbi:MAG: ABC transporter permease subunit [Anaerolineales bacterium]|nr:ABC transporter permease subunit [Anaerolineales bacterium]
MFAVFSHALKRSFGAIIGWGLSLGLMGAFMLGFYDTIAAQGEQLQAMIKQYPPELMAAFGGMNIDLFSPEGFLHMEFFSYMPLVIGIFAVLAGSSLLAGDEENGILDLLLAYPIQRTSFFLGRSLAFAATMFIILASVWLGFALVLPSTTMDLTILELTQPFLSLLVLLLLFGTLALLLSMLLPSRNIAAMSAGLLLTFSFFVPVFASMDKKWEKIARFFPMDYYQGGFALSGINWEWFGGLLAFGALFALLAWLLFLRRDIRVSGEGTWKLPNARPQR